VLHCVSVAVLIVVSQLVTGGGMDVVVDVVVVVTVVVDVSVFVYDVDVVDVT